MNTVEKKKNCVALCARFFLCDTRVYLRFVGSEAVAAVQPVDPAAVPADPVSRQEPEEQGGGANMTELLISRHLDDRRINGRRAMSNH